MSHRSTWDEFRAAERFPGLDGWRALSIVLVLTSHMHDPVWDSINGALGVTLFFVISGFLITTLLLRESDRKGRVSLRNFYVRRVFRIVPMYFLALGITALAVLGFGLGEGGGNFLSRLPLLATFNGEFAGSGTFSHSWSLGIEEKFYIVWPLLAFGITFIKSRLGIILAFLVPLAFIASYLPVSGYFGIYMPIIGGCAMAVLMHSERGFRVASALARPVPAVVIALLMTLWVFFGEKNVPIDDQSRYGHTVFGLLGVLALPAILIGQGVFQRFFSLRAITYYGTFAYGVYLFHPFVIDVTDRLVKPGSSSLLAAAERFLLVFVVSFAVAWVLGKFVEQPFIRLGRRLTSNFPSPGRLAPDVSPASPARH